MAKCKNCNNLFKRRDDDGTLYDWCGMIVDCPDTEMERNCKYFVHASNADKIRAMSDEELVDFLYWTADGSGKTQKQWLDWLKEECE